VTRLIFTPPVVWTPIESPPADDFCRVYWGSHGCERERGHRGPHRCEPDCPPRGYGRWWRVFGEDIWWFLRVWQWLVTHPGGHRRLWWLLRHHRPWPLITVREWERLQGVPWPPRTLTDADLVALLSEPRVSEP
jgi:hypothetical protein